MDTDKAVGISVGGLIGLLSGYLIDNTILTGLANPRSFRNLLIISTKLVVTTVGLWFGMGAGTGWASSKLFGEVVSPTVVAWYFIALFVGVLVMTGRLFIRFAILAGNSVPVQPGKVPPGDAQRRKR